MRKKDRSQFRKLFVFFLSFALLILHVPTQVHAASGDFSIDFAAAAPYSYDHLTGGGAFDDGTIGTHADVVESLQGGDFRCGDLVTYLVRIAVNDTDSADADAPQTIRLDFSFLADTTGQTGVGLIDIKSVKVNYGSVQDLIPSEDHSDSGIIDDGGSQATLVDEHFSGTPFTPGALLLGSVTVDDLERNETVIVRIDVKLGCKPGSDPTGNLQADLQSAWLIATGAGAVEPPQAVPGGAQTIPFKQIGDIGAADIEIEKTVRVAGTSDSFTDSVTILNGTAVEYSYVVTNLATTQPPGAPLYDVTVMDDNGTPANSADDFTVSLSGLTDMDGDGHPDDLAIGGTATGTATRTISTTAESVVNTAKASGKDSIYMPNTLTDSDTATVQIEHPSISLEKTGALVDQNGNGRTDVGDKITYAFRIENTGNVTLTNVRLSDPKITLSGGPIASLAPGAVNTTTYTGVYWLTQTDIDKGTFQNVATVTGTPPRGPDVTDTDDDIQTLTRSPAIQLEKTGTLVDQNGDGIDNAGDKITYSFTVRNTGNVTLTNVNVTDKVGGVAISGSPIASLAPGAVNTTAFTGVYWLTQADIDAGTFTNIATATGSKPGGGTVSDDDDDTQPLTRKPSIQLEKTGTYVDQNHDSVANVGDKIVYAFTVRNTGNVTLTQVTVTDTVGGVTINGGPLASLAPGAVDSTTFTGVYWLTQADVDAGTFTNIATASGMKPGGGTVSDEDDDTQAFTRKPSIQLEKTGTLVDQNGDGIDSAGDKITYTFVVRNTGNVTLTNIRLTDPLIAISGGPLASLAPGTVDTTTFTGIHQVTQADIDAGTFTNIATVTGTPPVGPDVTDTDDDTQRFVRNPALTLEKSGTFDAGADGFADPGELITYAFVVRNTGNVTLHHVTVTDPLPGLSAITLPKSTLAVGESMTGTATYAVTQADIDAGFVTNLATADSDESGPDDDDHYQPLPQDPMLELTKTGTFDAGADGFADPGELITYTFIVRNTGNVTLHHITVTDPLPGLSAITLPKSTLAVGESMTGTATYAVTQADIDAGFVANLATADSDESGPDDDDHNQPLPQDPMLELTKTGTFDAGGDGYADPGELINYTFIVRNTGNVTLHHVTVTDPLPGLSAITLPKSTLAVGESMTGTATYAVTQADIDAGFVANLATADSDESGPDDDNHNEPLPQVPEIDLEKTGAYSDENGDQVFNVGDRITYTFLVRNTGNVTLTNIRLTDPLISISGGPLAILAPGAINSTTFTGVYWLTQADIDAGTFTNIATVTGTPPVGPDLTDTDDDTQRFVRNPALTLEKSGTFDAGGDGYADPGELITYTFVVRNTGNVTLHHVTVTDPLPGLSAITLPKSTLAVGESMTGTATYAVTQADIDAGFVANLATADSDESGPDDDDHNEPLPQDPMLELTKTGTFDAGGDGYADPGELITYTFIVRNTGNVTLHHVTVTDPLPGLSAITLPKSTLAVGESMTGTATYAVTQTDIDAGFVANLATADSDESGPDDDDHNQPLPQNPILELEKSGSWVDGDGDGRADAGETVIYLFTVRNIGNVTLHHVTVTDPKIPLITYVSGDDGDEALQVDETWIFTADYLLTQEEIDAGFVYNLAVADSDESDDDVGDENIVLPQQAGIQIVKTTNGTDGPEIPVGATVTWRYVVTNAGNVTLSEITVTDDQEETPVYVSGDLNSDGRLDLGEAWIFEATGMAVEGAYENTGTASGRPPESDRVSDEDSSRYFGYILGIHLEKDVANLTQEGIFADYAELEEDETARYRLTIRNDSNVSLIHVIVTDTEAKPGTVVTIEGGGTLVWTAGSGDLAELSIGSLAAGAQIVLTYDYRTLHSDIGEPIVNTAVVTGVPGEELHMDEYPALYDEDEATISVEAIPLVTTSVDIRKQVRNQTANGIFADMATGYAGDIFCFFVEITNDGETLLSHVTLTDDRAVIGSQLIRTGDEAQLTWTDDGHGKARIVIGELEPGESVGYLYRVTATEDDEGDSITNTATVKAEFLPTVPGYDVIPLEKSDEATIMVLEPPPITGESGQTGQMGAGVLLLTLAAAILLMRRRIRPMVMARKPDDEPEGLDPD